jgi:DNA polymerase I
LTEYRRVAKMQSSYVDNLVTFIDLNGRVHADFRITGTEVGRLSVSDPALQTIPRAGDYYGSLIRSLFIARPGYKIVVVDYSQAELRVFACLSGEPFLIKVYMDGRDLHTEVAVAMFGSGYTKEQRVLCKMFNFSYVYGGNEHSFAQDSGLNIQIASQFVHDYDRLMPIGKQFKQDQLKLLRAQGYVESVFGRRRHFPLITPETLDEARKAAVHMPCAGTASDLTLLSALDAKDRGIPVCLTVHDSVLAECREDLANEQAEEIAHIMQSNGTKFMPQVPWKADIDIGDSWAKAPEIENA